MKRELPDRSQILFGRQPDLDYLLQRTERPGLTAVVGRAQMGKSWLLTELARQLSIMKPPVSTVPSILAQPPVLVGFTEALGETADLLLRAVVDLYSRWLSDSTYLQQAKVVYDQQNKDLIGRAGKAVGNLFEKISKLAFMPGEVIGGLVKETFESLASANQELLSGAIQLPRLQIEQARDLLSLVHKITNCHIVLVFDQWEKSTGIQLESNILDSFLRGFEGWPPCHIVLGLRPDENPRIAIKKLRRDFPGAVDIYDVPPMHLDGGDAEPLLRYVREKVSIEGNVTGADLLDMISGYPGVVYQWTNTFNALRHHSLEELRKIADDAQANRFGEFEVLLPELSDPERGLAIRLALLPESRNPESWKSLKSITVEGFQAKALDSLKWAGVLESISPPTFGHAKRHEAARKWLTENCREELKEACELLALSLSGYVRDVSPEVLPYASSLVALSSIASSLELSLITQAIAEAATSLFESSNTNAEKLLQGVTSLRPDYGIAASLLAMGLYNTLNDAKHAGRLAQRDSLLGALRKLQSANPDNPAVREQFAQGLVNTMVYAKQEEKLEQRNALLGELRRLRCDFPGDIALRENLVIGLYNSVVDAKLEEKLEQRDALLDEMRDLQRDYPEDPKVRSRLSNAMLSTVNDFESRKQYRQRDALLDELRNLQLTYSSDIIVREDLAGSLYNTFHFASPHLNFALLDELRNLQHSYLDDAFVRGLFSKGLAKVILDALQEQPRGLLGELRDLQRNHPADPTVRLWLAKVLGKMVIDAPQNSPNLASSDLLQELRALVRSYPEDANVRQVLDVVER